MNKVKFVLFSAGISLALVFTFGCSSDDGSDVIYGTPVTYRGETYQTVVIGRQTWMARNLNYDVNGSKCYNNSQANCKKYGKLYTWATAMVLPDDCNTSVCASQINAKHQGICPSGWHIPSDAEWTTLTNFVGTNAGAKLKATSDWNRNRNGNGTDDYGFAALPGGDGGRSLSGTIGNWWSSSERNAKNAYYRNMEYSHKRVDRDDDNKSLLYSIRCLQN